MPAEDKILIGSHLLIYTTSREQTSVREKNELKDQSIEKEGKERNKILVYVLQ